MDNTMIPKGFLKDSKGRLVPEENISDVDKARDSLVREIAEKAQDLSKRLAEFKAQAMADISAFVDLSIEKYGIKRGGQKGNITLRSFDGEICVSLVVAEKLDFDERIHAAKSLIDECLKDWIDGGRAELRPIVCDAFNVDKQGRLNTKQILALRRYNISDDRWKRAMEAISDSLYVSGSKSYVRIHKRTESGEYKQVNLDVYTA